MSEAMGIAGLTSSAGPGPADGRLAEAQRSFEAALSRARGREGGSAPERARKAAEEFVAIALVQPVLAQLRESDGSAPPFAPSRAEKQFRALLDAQLAQQITHAARFPLVDRVARDLLRGVGA